MNLRIQRLSFSASTMALLLGAVLPAAGQGTFICSNIRLRNALITDCSGSPVSGTNFVVEVRASHPQTRQLDAGLIHVTATTNRPLDLIPVLTGKNAGRFYAGTVLVPFVPPGTEATLEIRAWDRTSGTRYEDARVRGVSTVKVQLGGVGQPPTLPGTMSQFTGIKLCPGTAAAK